MKNVLFIGPYYQSDEWGKNAKGMIDIISNIEDVNLTIRPIWMNNELRINSEEEKIYSKYEDNIFENYDVLIQNVLPQYFIKNESFKTNILYSSLNCFIDSSGWSSNIQLADKIIVSSNLEKEIFSKVTTKNQEIINLNYAPYYKCQKAEDLNLSFYQKKFLFVGGSEPKSGIYETIIAYLSAFNIYDNAILIIATTDDKEVMEQINSIKYKLGIYQNVKMYANIAVVSSNDDQIIEFLTSYSDFYIDVSYNSKIGQGTLSAIFNDKVPILLDTTKESIGSSYPLLVDSFPEISLADKRPFMEMYSGEYYWNMPNTVSLKNILLKAYNEDSTIIKEKLKEFKSSYNLNIRNKIKEAIGCSL